MSETLETYTTRQAATVGRQVQTAAPPVWVPNLPDAEGACLGTLQRPSQYGTFPPVAIFPDGRRVVTGHPDGALVCWELENGSQVWTTPAAHTDGIRDVAVASDGNWVATASKDKHVGVWDAASGQRLLLCQGHEGEVYRICWAPDGSRLASAAADGTLRVWDARTGAALYTRPVHAAGGDAVRGLDWSPDGRWLASGDQSGIVRIWAAATVNEVRQHQLLESVTIRLQWSPDGATILVGYIDGTLLVLDGDSGAEHLRLKEQCRLLAVAWSPDGRYVVGGHNRDGKRLLKVWDAQSGAEVRRFTFPEEFCYKLAWESGGGYIASSHWGSSPESHNVVRLWDTRDLLVPDAVTPPAGAPEPLAAGLRLLPGALAQLHRLEIHPPLSLVQDLLDLTGGRGGAGPLAALAGAPGIQALSRLRWSAPARSGLVALLLHGLPFPQWAPPAEITPTQVRDKLASALAGSAIPPAAPDPPLAALRAAANRIDERLLSLLTLLGPEAVAAEPGLPLRLLAKVDNLPALTSAQRRLLGVRVAVSEHGGEAAGHAVSSAGGQVGGITLGSLDRTLRSLLPSQLALPSDLLTYRHLRRELLLRAPQVAEPPRLRPTVLLLDVSPPTFGPVEALTRLAAFVVARSLRAAGTPLLLITPGERGELIHPLEQPADLVEIWTARTLTPIDPVRSLRLASAVRSQLQDESGLEPIILLLSHPWFGADDDLPVVSGLRGLFVQYPGQQVRPALAAHCERWHSLAAGQTNGLAELLGRLVG